MSRFSRCEFCGKRGHQLNQCAQYLSVRDTPRTPEDTARDRRIWDALQANPTFQEETARRRAAKKLGNDPDRKPTWRERRRRRGL